VGGGEIGLQPSQKLCCHCWLAMINKG